MNRLDDDQVEEILESGDDLPLDDPLDPHSLRADPGLRAGASEALDDTPYRHEDPTATSGTIRIGKALYAAGLYWETVTTPSAILDRARKTASRIKADVYAVRTKAPGYGFSLGWKVYGHTARQPAFAAAVAEKLGPSWLVALELEDGRWWYGSCFSAAIYPEQDAIYLNEEDILRRVRQELSISNNSFNRVYVPSRWGIPDSRPDFEDATPADIIGPTKAVLAGVATVGDKIGRLFRSKSGKGINPIVIGLAVLAAAGGGGAYYMAQSKAAQAEAERLQKEAEFRQKRLAQLSSQQAPWGNRALPSSWISACVGTASATFTHLPGWAPASFECGEPTAGGPVKLTMRWEKLPGAMVQDVLAALPSMGLSGFAIDPSGRYVEASRTVEGIPVPAQGATGLRSTSEKALDEFQIRARLIDMLAPSRIDPKITTQKAPPQQKSAAPPPRLPMLFEFTSRMPSEIWTDGLDAIPGLLVLNVRYDAPSANWTTKGIVYDAPPTSPTPARP